MNNRNKIDKMPLLIMSIFAIVFTVLGVSIYFFVYRDNGDKVLLFTSIVFLIVGIFAILGIFGYLKEINSLKLRYYPLVENMGTSSILEFARKLESTLTYMPYEIFTNDKGIVIVAKLNDIEMERVKSRGYLCLPGVLLLSTQDPDKYKQINIDVVFSMQGGQIDRQPIYKGGRSYDFSSSTEISYDKGKGVNKTTVSSKDSITLDQMISKSKKEDGWKATFDAVSLYGLQMGILGLSGVVIVIIGLIFSKLT